MQLRGSPEHRRWDQPGLKSGMDGKILQRANEVHLAIKLSTGRHQRCRSIRDKNREEKEGSDNTRGKESRVDSIA